jgi:hypothetical protein
MDGSSDWRLKLLPQRENQPYCRPGDAMPDGG